MNFLELCKRLRQECSVSGTGPAAVTGQTGEMLRIINWVQTAHQNIQQEYIDWKFLWKTESFPTLAAQSLYDLTNQVDMSGIGNIITDFNQFARYSEERGAGPRVWCNGLPIEYIEWDNYDAQDWTGAGSQQPYAFTIRPDGKWLLLPTPNAVYTISFDYYRTPFVMVSSTDTPLIPAEFHDAIIGKGMMYYAHYEDAAEVLEAGIIRYEEAMRSLKADQLPRAASQRYSTSTGIVVVPE